MYFPAKNSICVLTLLPLQSSPLSFWACSPQFDLSKALSYSYYRFLSDYLYPQLRAQALRAKGIQIWGLCLVPTPSALFLWEELKWLKFWAPLYPINYPASEKILSLGVHFGGIRACSAQLLLFSSWNEHACSSVIPYGESYLGPVLLCLTG